MPSTTRAPLAGPDAGPVAPFPLRLAGPVIKGFGRGSAELQIPTANIPIAGLSVGGLTAVDSGVYFGFASLSSTRAVYPMVMSIGWNPFYKNTVRSVEVHIVHQFADDFYGDEMRLCVLGWIRPELDYVSKEALIEDIRTDIRVGLDSMDRAAYSSFQDDAYLMEFGKEEVEP